MCNKKKKKHTKVSPDDILKSINHMVAFIEREGDEKSKDIDEKTEEEYNILKGNTMQTERIKIDDEFRMKEQRLKVTSLTDASILANRIRLDAVRAKHEHIEDMREEIRKQIQEDMRCILRYGRILQLLIIEGLYKLMDTSVIIKCREEDFDLIQKTLPTIIAAYKTTTGRDVEIKLDEKNFLAKNCLGGIELLKENHKVTVTNTLDERLNQTIEYCIPAIQKSLFNKTVG